MCREIESTCKGSGWECLFRDREGECTERERERERVYREREREREMERVYREREGECFREIEGVCREIE